MTAELLARTAFAIRVCLVPVKCSVGSNRTVRARLLISSDTSTPGARTVLARTLRQHATTRREERAGQPGCWPYIPRVGCAVDWYSEGVAAPVARETASKPATLYFRENRACVSAVCDLEGGQP